MSMVQQTVAAILGALLVICLGASLYAFYQINEKEQLLDKLNSKFSQSEDQKDQLQRQLEDARAQMNKVETDKNQDDLQLVNLHTRLDELTKHDANLEDQIMQSLKSKDEAIQSLRDELNLLKNNTPASVPVESMSPTSAPTTLGFQHYYKCSGDVFHLGDTGTADRCLAACIAQPGATGCWWLDGSGGFPRTCNACQNGPPTNGDYNNDWGKAFPNNS